MDHDYMCRMRYRGSSVASRVMQSGDGIFPDAGENMGLNGLHWFCFFWVGVAGLYVTDL